MGKYFLLYLILLSNGAFAQAVTQFIDSFVSDAYKHGAKEVIVAAQLCSACEDISQGFIFTSDYNGGYQVRCLLYIDRYKGIKVIEDTVFQEKSISDIFDIADKADSLLYQVKNIERILSNLHYENGVLVGMPPPEHGKMRYLNLHLTKGSAESFVSVLDINSVFYKANDYWLLSSFINNFIRDNLFWFPMHQRY